MSRYVIIKPTRWASDKKGRLTIQFGECVGVADIFEQTGIRHLSWYRFMVETISKPEYETLLAFGLEKFDLAKEAPVIQEHQF